MKCAAGAAWSAVLLVSVATGAYSATAQSDPSPSKAEQAKTSRSLESLFGKTLISIDGSTIAMTASEGRILREIVAPNGAVQRSTFMFINARLGTVSDPREGQRVSGVFRASDQEILIQYADGSSEIVLPNAQGGITIESISPKNPTFCTSWYPEGHVFSLDDRKAALLQYANRLGLGVSTEKAAGAPARSGCDSAASSASAASSTTSGPAASPVPAATPAPAAPAPPAAAPAMDVPGTADKAASAALSPPGAGAPVVLPGIADATAMAAAAATAKAAKGGELAAAKVAELPMTDMVEVRTSEVHLIDKPASEPMTTVAVATPAPALATATTASAVGAANSNEPGASSCLSVESDGGHWGFRNKCAYTVQFAYCTMDGRNSLTACKDGFVGGSVAANGFGVLVADENSNPFNQNHDFRWVACQGGAGEVIARLDKSDPPVGRCVR